MKSRLARGLMVWAAISVLALASVAGATVARFLPLEEHVALSQLVVRARVSGITSFASQKDGRPRTDTKLIVLESFKGNAQPGAELVLRQMRGTVDGDRFLSIPGDPVLKDGEEVVLFLAVDEKGTTYLTAMAQSKYEVVRDASGAWVRRNLDGLALTIGDDGRVVESIEEAPIPLSLFGDTIREIVKGK